MGVSRKDRPKKLLGRLIALRRYANLKDFIRFCSSIYKNRKIIWQIVLKEFRKKYLGSFFGAYWAFVQPLVFVLVLWLVFTIGLRQSRNMDGLPFHLWLMIGMFVWYFIADSLSSGATSIIQSAYIVKKVKFQASILPIVKIIDSLLVHLFFIALLMILLVFYGIFPNLYWLQVLYYLFATIIFAIGITWISSSLSVFAQDVSHGIQIITRIGFWFTPIFWSPEKLPETQHLIKVVAKLNPAYYLVMGYRESLIYGTAFWQHPYQTIYFWVVTLVLFVGGGIIFRRLRPHFADLL